LCEATAGGQQKYQVTGEGRDVVVKMLKIGLDLLAVHYGMLGRKAG